MASTFSKTITVKVSDIKVTQSLQTIGNKAKRVISNDLGIHQDWLQFSLGAIIIRAGGKADVTVKVKYNGKRVVAAKVKKAENEN